jgi:PAS domain S-box-containing protein
MNYQDKTKDELITELQKLRQLYDSLKVSYEKEISEFKLIEKGLMESEERYRLLFENTGEAILLTNPDGQIYSSNPEACRIFGMSEEEICNLGRTGVVDLNDPNLEPALNERKITGKSKTELCLFRKNGTKFPAEVTSNIFTDASGNQRTSMIIRDISERSKAEKELRLQSEIMKNITEGINLIRYEDGFIVFTNQKFDEMFGYGHGELIGKHVSILNAPDGKSPEEIKQDIVDTLNIMGEWHGEILNIKKNGDQFWCYVNVSVFDHHDHGKVFLSVHTDITERKKAEEAIRESEARFRGIFDNSVVGISAAYPDGRLFLVNKAFAIMYGYDTPEVLLKQVGNAEKLYATKKERSKLLQALRKNGYIDGVEVEVERRDGSHFFVLVSARDIKDVNGILLYSIGTHVDLSERKRIEKKINDTSIYARNLIEASLDPLVTINKEGKIMDVNLATEHITGKTRDKLIGTDFSDYFTEPKKAEKGYKIAFSKGIVRDYPLTIVHSNGSKTQVLYNATVFKDEIGEVQGVFAAARDITDRKKMEEELRKSKELLENLNQHLTDIRENERTIISREIHDRLGQSLTALKIDMTWLNQKISSESEESRKLNEMIELVNATSLDVHRISSELRPAMLDDLGLAAALEWYCEEFANRTGLKVQMEIDDVHTEKIDKDLSIYRVAQESLTNIVRHADAKMIQIKLRKTKENIVLLIQDDGIGISPDKIRSSKSLGLLGMSERVNQSGGQIEFIAPNKGGTKIRVYMPIK